MKKFVSLFLAIIITASVLATTPMHVYVNAASDGSQYLSFVEINYRKEYAVSSCSNRAVGNIVIPATYNNKPVTKINSQAFSHRNITSVVIPDSIKEIGDSAFSYCQQLNDITMPDTPVLIGSHVFNNTLYQNTTENRDEDGCLYVGKHLVSVLGYTKDTFKTKEDTLSIAGYVFYGANLTSVEITGNVKIIGKYAFHNCPQLKSVVLHDGVETLANSAFSQCNALTNITFPGSISVIDEYVFGLCQNLTDITICDGVQKLGRDAFKGSKNIETVNLPDSNIAIDINTFAETKIYQNTNNWTDGAFYIDNHLITLTRNIYGSLTIREGTTNINGQALPLTKELSSITIPKSVKVIGENAFKDTNIVFIFYEGNETEFSQINFTNNLETLSERIIFGNSNRAQKPATPKVTAASNHVGGVKITWTPVKNAVAYAVYRRGAGATNWEFLGVTTETSAIDTTAKHRQYWRYSVQAISENGASTFDTNGKYLKYIATPDLTELRNIDSGLTLSWRSVTGASGYRVYRRGAGEKYWTYLGTVKTTSYTDTAVKNKSGNYYRYTVRAVVDGWYSSYEDYLYTKRLATPTITSVVCKGNNRTTVTWKPIKGATGYYVDRYSELYRTWERIAYVKGANATTYTDPKGDIQGVYSYRVYATTGKAASAPSKSKK